MPARSEKQRRFMAMQLAKKRAGKKADVDMTEEQLKHYAKGKKKHKKKNS